MTAAVKAVAPRMKFLGLGLGAPSDDFFEYFLNASNHAPNAPLAEAIDYHNYGVPASRTDVTTYPGLFDSADRFVEVVKKAEVISLLLHSPLTVPPFSSCAPLRLCRCCQASRDDQHQNVFTFS